MVTKQELRDQLRAALYERDFLQSRLDSIRFQKDKIVMLLDTKTYQETLEQDGEEAAFQIAGRKWG